MSNPLKKTMVFLGLAEEDLEEQAAAAPVQRAAQPAPVAEPAAARPAAQQPRAAAVTPLRRVTPTRQAAPQPLSEILTVRPTEYSGATVIAENFREGIPVIINLSAMVDGDAKRLIDFASGLTMGLHGRIERVTSKVFLLTPEHIEIAGEDSATRDENGSFFVTPTA
ncbi:cell division inhibitor SepF [Leucobacter exalbidus]|uniref:Cell division protein SepF n=1 Tax=Leucobacter exalbidus TaxID=662960 RepID=A0A940PUL7_9MICO|nr:cell division protein SepF [Leucobacter exalbidus]MBP1325536.1 cell division inhibitor SepF [Leucobacter exalbidus]